MKMEFDVEKTVRERVSVRTYREGKVSAAEKEKINVFIDQIVNPFQIPVSFRILEKEASAKGEKLGTYGVIKGASNFICATVKEAPLALEALGYSFEKLILYVTSLGLGTCWLGGTFDKSGFAAAMEVKENELFPVVSPLGIPFGKKRTMESITRWAIKADKRKEWQELFFQQDFSHPLDQAEAGEYVLPLKMLQLAPSAANKQPWRVVKQDNIYHFYEMRTIDKEGKHRIDIQKVDMGIAACHFHMAALENELSGHFEVLNPPKMEHPGQACYQFSWIGE
jgi:nitroreductase